MAWTKWPLYNWPRPGINRLKMAAKKDFICWLGKNCLLYTSTATTAFKQPIVKAKNDGRVIYTEDLRTVENADGNFVVLNKDVYKRQAQANNPLDEQGNFTTSRVTAREKGEFIEVDPADVHLSLIHI